MKNKRMFLYLILIVVIVLLIICYIIFNDKKNVDSLYCQYSTDNSEVMEYYLFVDNELKEKTTISKEIIPKSWTSEQLKQAVENINNANDLESNKGYLSKAWTENDKLILSETIITELATDESIKSTQFISKDKFKKQTKKEILKSYKQSGAICK